MPSNILLFLPSYFTPWTPPLGLSILKAYLEQRGHQVRCIDLNTKPRLWGMHHRYFTVLRALEGVSVNDGYSKLWYVLNAHLLAFVNGAPRAVCRQVIETVAPLYDIGPTRAAVDELLPIVERYFDELRDELSAIDLSRYDFVGTSTYTTSLSSSLFVLREAKRRNPRARTVMGGGIFADDLALGSDNLNTLIDEYPHVDHIVLGEGEMLFQKLVEGDLAHQRVISLADLDGRTVEMNELPEPDFSDFDLDNYYHLTIEGGRSCPFQCSFCSETTQWGAYRMKSRELLASQLDALAKRYGNNTFFMGDSLMNPYIMGFSKELLARGVDVLYDGYLRADKVAAERERTKLWAGSGVYRVRLGIESAAADVLKAMVKKTTPETISQALKALANAGIRTTTYWIVGYPGETERNFQETLDFIREHHRFIYELEAHPYYYYPYGQVGSRLYECHSLYPREVTDHTRFKIWEIVDPQPTRAEKYERLRRISELASELGLPNIYTMSDRYYAEERWQLYHPLAREVYPATHVDRRPVAPPAAPVAAPPLARRPAAAYSVAVDEALDVELLATALDRLAEREEMLRVGRVDDSYRPLAVPPGRSALRVLSGHGTGEAALARLASDLAAELAPVPGDSLRLALIPKGEAGAGALVLAVHPEVSDARGATFLLEDLYRLYRQSAAACRETLAPVGRTFLESYAGADGATDGPAALYDGLGLVQRIRGVPLDGGRSGIDCRREGERRASLALLPLTCRRLFSQAVHECGLRPVEVLAAAVADLGRRAARPVAIEATVDLRSTDEALRRSVGPWGAIRPLPPLPEPGDVATLADALRAIAPRSGTADPTAARVLFATDRLVAEAWLEGDLWQARGFLPIGEGVREPYVAEISPRLTPEGLALDLRWTGEATPWGEPEAAAERFLAALDAVLARCESRAAALAVVRGTLSGAAPNFESLVGARPAGDWQESAIEIDREPVDRLAAALGGTRSDVLRAAFALLVSRLSGREDVPLLAAEEGERGIAPLRLRPSWLATFAPLLRQASRQTPAAFASGVEAVELAAAAGVRFDVGLGVFTAAGSLLDRLAPAVESGLDLCLDLRESGSCFAGRLRHRAGGGRDELAAAIGGHFGHLLAALAESPDVPLGEVALEPVQRASTGAALAAEAFQF